jgi:hypothetical protein
MKANQVILFLLFFSIRVYSHAQTAEQIYQMEVSHKECLGIKPDSIACSRVFFYQMDSMVNVVYNKAKEDVSPDERSQFIKEQLSWAYRKESFFKKQDENFIFNLKEGTWKKEMIRIVYEQKADFLLKRIKSLLKHVIQ